MAYLGLDDLIVYKEYCIKPKDTKCPIDLCYDTEGYMCKYWYQEKITSREAQRRNKEQTNDR